jgi:hypothetical protein
VGYSVGESHLDLSNDLLKIAESAQAKAENSKGRDGVIFHRSACHNYYYSAYHICLHLIPEIAERAGKSRSGHLTANEEVAIYSYYGAKLLKRLKKLREWADYDPKPSRFEESKDAYAVKSLYLKFIKLINSAIPDDAKKR